MRHCSGYMMKQGKRSLGSDKRYFVIGIGMFPSVTAAIDMFPYVTAANTRYFVIASHPSFEGVTVGVYR